MRNVDITGKKFNNLTAIRYDHKEGHHHYWLFKCDCGAEKIIKKDHVVCGRIKSCGCFSGGITYGHHGKHKTRLYHTWKGMKRRCFNTNTTHYADYGGRGIKMCNSWKEAFLPFYTWAIENGYKDDLTLDRIDVNGDYCPENCRWITLQEQQYNKRNNVLITYRGTTKCLNQWAEILGIKKDVLYYRIRQGGWSVEDAFNKPTQKRKNT